MTTFPPWLSPCRLSSRGNSPFVCALNFPLQEQKLKLHSLVGSSSWQIRPGRLCCDLVGLTLSARVGLALCRPALSSLLKQSCCQAEVVSLIWRPPGLQVLSIFTWVFLPIKVAAPVRSLLGQRRMNWRAGRLLSGLGSAFCLGWSDSLSRRALHNMMQTLLTDCGARGRGKGGHQGLPLFYLLFSLSFQSRDQSAVHTHALLTPFPLHLSIQQPVII